MAQEASSLKRSQGGRIFRGLGPDFWRGSELQKEMVNFGSYKTQVRVQTMSNQFLQFYKTYCECRRSKKRCL